MPGRTKSILQWYSAADIYVLSSLYEGFPNTLLEAMSSGLPCISVDCDTGPGDIINHDVNGFLVPEYDQNGFVDTLCMLMKNADKRKEISTNAVEVNHTYSIQNISRSWENLFEELTSV